MTEKKSRLQELLVINATERPLTKEEKNEAVQLMGDENGSEGPRCFLCGQQGVGGCDLCAGHAYYAMATRK